MLITFIEHKIDLHGRKTYQQILSFYVDFLVQIFEKRRKRLNFGWGRVVTIAPYNFKDFHTHISFSAECETMMTPFGPNLLMNEWTQ